MSAKISGLPAGTVPTRIEPAKSRTTNTLISRKFALRDLESYLAICKERIGQEVIGYQRALSAWRMLIKSPAFNYALVEAAKPIGGHRIVGFGASVFVSAQFADDEIRNPKPGLNERVISSIDRGEAVVLTESELGHENTYGGLSMVVLYSNWPRDAGLSPEQVGEAKMELVKIGTDRFSGYKLERMVMEALDEIDIEYFQSTGVWRFISDFEEFYAKSPNSNWRRGRMLAMIDRASALSVVGSVTGIIFRHDPPVLRFSKTDQQLLIAALEGLTDHELAQELKLNLQTVKKRWASVFARVADVMPGLLPEMDEVSDRQTRGPQKRHHLLAYLRRHPEELRPFVR